MVHVEIRGASVRLDIELGDGAVSIHGIFVVADSVGEKEFYELPKLYEYTSEEE